MSFRAENGSVYAWWPTREADTYEWVHWRMNRCLGMARYWRSVSRQAAETPYAHWRKLRVIDDLKALLAAMWAAREQRKTVQIRKAA